jgi:DNA-binding Xre family transcriptional regulator
MSTKHSSYDAHLEAPDYTKNYKIRLRLSELLVERGITKVVKGEVQPNLTEAARLTGVHWNTLERAANGRVGNLTNDNLLRLCLGLKASPNDIYEIVERDEKDATNDKNASPTPD